MFRSLGASLAVGLNAGRWSFTLVLLTKVGLESAGDHKMYIIYALLALITDIILEGYKSPKIIEHKSEFDLLTETDPKCENAEVDFFKSSIFEE